MAEDSQEPAQEVKLKIKLPSSIGANIDFVETTHVLQETISDVREALASASQLNCVTNYSLVYNGVRVTEVYDDFEPLSEVLLGATGDVNLDLVVKAYTLKTVNEHLVRLRENIGFNFFDHASRSLSIASGSEKFSLLGLNAVQPFANPEKDEDKLNKEVLPAKISDEDVAKVKEVSNAMIDESLILLNEHALSRSILSLWKLPIKSISISPWNPVPHQQRLKGDLLYLTLTTLESETFSITCHASGFYVNRNSNANFNPAVKVDEKGVSHKEYILFNLIAKLSKNFSATISDNKELLVKASQFLESYQIPSQVVTRFPWTVAANDASSGLAADISRTQLSAFANGVDGADFVKDWNDEFQGIKEFPRDTFNERLLRDKLLNKYIQEFNLVAIKTAVEIVKENLTPLNPNEPRDKHIFLRNNIFFSFGVNATGAHDQTGGDEAARYCFAKDLASVKLLNRIDTTGVCNLLTCIVDYLGERIICQAPVPGVFNDQKDHDGKSIDKVAYGFSLDDNKININDKFTEPLRPIAESFHLKSHAVEVASGASTEGKAIAISKDTKGIFGTDGRKYIIDLYRTTPLDINFLENHYEEGSRTGYPHKEASLRHEAVEEWYKRRAAAIFKVETEKLEKEGALKEGEKPQVAIPFDQIVFNPDAFTGLNEGEEDRATVREMSGFVTKNLIPEFLDDISRNAVPYDGAQLSDYMHKSGINMRYLGEVAKQAISRAALYKNELEETIKANEAEIARRRDAETADATISEESADKEPNKDQHKDKEIDDKSEGAMATENTEKDTKPETPKQEPTAAKMIPVAANMKALYDICVQEMIARASKHVLRSEGNNVPFLLKSHFVAHFHNCLLGDDVNPSPKVAIDENIKTLFPSEQLEFTSLDPAAIKSLISKEVFARFRHTLKHDWVQNIKPMQTLREIAFKFGIQWKAQDYHFTKDQFEAATKVDAPEQASSAEQKGKKSKKKAPIAKPVANEIRSTVFAAEDIVSFVPLVKDSSYRCSFVDEVFETARLQMRNGEKQIGLDLMAELVTFYQQIYGSVQQETAGFYSTLAQIYSECEMHAEASIIARKSAILHERLTGLDSYETINSYVKASFFDSLNKDHVSAFKLNAKALKDWSLIYGENHPNTVNTYSNFATILHELNLNSEAKTFYFKALDLSVALNGEVSDITAIIRHRIAVLLVQNNEYRPALEHFAKAANTFSKVVGPDDTLTKECSNFAQNLKKYIIYSEKQQAEKKSVAKKPKAGKSTLKTPTPSSNGKKANVKPVTRDAEIASKSVDEILEFIEGSGAKKNKKSKNKK